MNREPRSKNKLRATQPFQTPRCQRKMRQINKLYINVHLNCSVIACQCIIRMAGPWSSNRPLCFQLVIAYCQLDHNKINREFWELLISLEDQISNGYLFIHHFPDSIHRKSHLTSVFVHVMQNRSVGFYMHAHYHSMLLVLLRSLGMAFIYKGIWNRFLRSAIFHSTAFQLRNQAETIFAAYD